MGVWQGHKEEWIDTFSFRSMDGVVDRRGMDYRECEMWINWRIRDIPEIYMITFLSFQLPKTSPFLAPLKTSCNISGIFCFQLFPLLPLSPRHALEDCCKYKVLFFILEQQIWGNQSSAKCHFPYLPDIAAFPSPWLLFWIGWQVIMGTHKEMSTIMKFFPFQVSMHKKWNLSEHFWCHFYKMDFTSFCGPPSVITIWVSSI